jgi:HD-GYP domain-containing protein (c-di-GMP phosphodiesterase class II)
VNATVHKKIALAVAFGASGIGALVLLAFHSTWPPWWLWLLLTAIYAFLEYRSVLVDERLAVSPAVMALFAAAIIFGRDGVMAVAVMAAAGTLSARDFRERRWFQPAVNFGQLVLSATVGAVILQWLLPAEITPAGLWRVAIAGAVAALVYDLVNLTLVGFIVRHVYQRNVWSGSDLRSIALPFVGMGLLGGLLGAAYVLIGPVVLPLLIIGLLVGQMAVEAYNRRQRSQESTLRAFMKILEAKDIYGRGRSDAVATFTDLAADALGLDDTRRRNLHMAAVVREITKLAVPHEIYRKRGPLTAAEYAELRTRIAEVERLLEGVGFLRPILEIVIDHSPAPPTTPPPALPPPASETARVDAAILKVAVAFEAMTSARSYRSALTQQAAIDELRAGSGTQFDPDVVAGFIAALQASGAAYGAFTPTGAAHG